MKITYENKISIQNDESVARKNKVTDEDMNEIKETVNANADEQIAMQTDINNIKKEQTTQNTYISNLQKDNTTNKQDIAEIKAKDTDQDKYIAELEAENTRLREDLNGLPKGQASGESIDLSDSAEMRCDLKISGNSKQETREGRNKFDIRDTKGTTINSIEKSSFTVSNKWNTKLIAGTDLIKDLEINTEYIITANVTLNVKPTTLSPYDVQSRLITLYNFSNSSIISVLNTDTAEEKQNWIVGETKKLKGNFITPNNLEDWYLTVSTYNATGSKFTFDNVMIRKATDINETYEPYGASPSSDYPSENESCGDNGSINEVIIGKNILPQNKEDWYQGTFDSNNGANWATNTRIMTNNFINVKQNTDYYLEITNKKYCFITIAMYNKDNTYIGQYYNIDNSINGATSIKVNFGNTGCEKIKVVLRNIDTTAEILISEIVNVEAKMVLNSQRQAYTIPVQQPMRSVGNTRDTFIKKDGKRYEHHPIVRIESYNGETITSEYMSNTGELSTGATVDYISDTPVDIECTEEQNKILDQIEKEAKTYKNVTHMYSTDKISSYKEVTYKIQETEVRTYTIQNEIKHSKGINSYSLKRKGNLIIFSFNPLWSDNIIENTWTKFCELPTEIVSKINFTVPLISGIVDGGTGNLIGEAKTEIRTDGGLYIKSNINKSSLIGITGTTTWFI